MSILQKVQKGYFRNREKDYPILTPSCEKLLDPYYKNFHICKDSNVKPTSIKQEIPTDDHLGNAWYSFRSERRFLRNGSGLAKICLCLQMNHLIGGIVILHIMSKCSKDV
jgi:hypothetical protein